MQNPYDTGYFYGCECHKLTETERNTVYISFRGLKHRISLYTLIPCYNYLQGNGIEKTSKLLPLDNLTWKMQELRRQ